MPTTSVAQALLDVSSPEVAELIGSNIWTDCPTWRGITNYVTPIWAKEATTSLAKKLQAPLLSFINRYWGLPASEQTTFLQGTKQVGKGKARATVTIPDNEVDGRAAYLEWQKSEYGKWTIKQVIKDVLKEQGSDPWSYIEDNGKPDFPTMKQADATSHTKLLADALFGEQAVMLHMRSNKLWEPIEKFVETITANTWNAWRVQMGRERSAIAKMSGQLDEEWAKFIENKDNCTKAALRKWLKRFQLLLDHMKKLRDPDSIKDLESRMHMLEEMMRIMGMDKDGKVTSVLPQTLIDALRNLANENQISELRALAYEAIISVNEDNEFELPLEEVLDMGWSEGTDKFKNLILSEVKQALGVTSMPFFNDYLDPRGEKTYLKDADWFADPQNEKIPCEPRWHQWIGILAILDAMWDKRNTLLMDEVGLGKTMQVAGVIAMLSAYRNYYEENNEFPGIFKGRLFQGQPGNIPDLPSLIVVPKSLLPQLTRELRRYLAHGSIDIFPYTGKYESRIGYWKKRFLEGHQRPGQKIVLATVGAMEDDASNVIACEIKEPGRTLNVKRHLKGSDTLFAQDWLVFALDEAHKVRTLNTAFKATWGLRTVSKFVLAVSATPITTSPKDIFNIGRCLGIEGLTGKDGDELYRDYTKTIGTANRKDRVAREEYDKQHAVPAIEGYKHQATDAAIQPMITDLRKMYDGHVIRRTGASTDCNGNPLAGIAPAREHALYITPFPHESTFLNELERKFMDHDEGGNDSGTRQSGKDFYIDIRRTLTHIACVGAKSGQEWKKPASVEEWMKWPSSKLHVLAQVVKHHHDNDNAPPLHIVNDREVEPNPAPEAAVHSRDPELPRDRIVVYSQFPSTSYIINDVLALYGIKTVEFNGSMSEKARAAALTDFKSDDPDSARVMIMSNVGQVGLNLDFANILIVIDALWSIMEDLQLQGRLKRYPQAKQVEVYRLISAGTADVLINQLANGKGVVHEQFTNASLVFQTVLRSGFTHSPAHDSDAEDEDDEDVEDDASSVRTTASRPTTGNQPRASTSKLPAATKAPPKKALAKTPVASKPRKGKSKSGNEDSAPGPSPSTSASLDRLHLADPPPAASGIDASSAKTWTRQEVLDILLNFESSELCQDVNAYTASPEFKLLVGSEKNRYHNAIKRLALPAPPSTQPRTKKTIDKGKGKQVSRSDDIEMGDGTGTSTQTQLPPLGDDAIPPPSFSPVFPRSQDLDDDPAPQEGYDGMDPAETTVIDKSALGLPPFAATPTSSYLKLLTSKDRLDKEARLSGSLKRVLGDPANDGERPRTPEPVAGPSTVRDPKSPTLDPRDPKRPRRHDRTNPPLVPTPALPPIPPSANAGSVGDLPPMVPPTTKSKGRK